MVCLVLFVKPYQIISVAACRHLDAVLEILCRQQIVGGIGYGEKSVLIGFAVQHKPMRHHILRGGDNRILHRNGAIGGAKETDIIGQFHVDRLTHTALGVCHARGCKGCRHDGIGQLCFSSDLYVNVAAPVIDDGNADADDLNARPHLVGVDSERRLADLGSADQEDLVGDLDGHLCVGLEKDLFGIVIVAKCNGALSDQNVKDVHTNGKRHIEIGVPVYAASQGIDDGHAANADVGKACGDAVQRKGDVGSCRKHVEERKLSAEHQRQRRDAVGQEEAFVNVINACSRAAHPEYAEGIDGNTRLDTANVEIDLIGDGESVVGLDVKLCLHLKYHKVGRTRNAKLPLVVDDLECKSSFDVRHAVGV